MPANAVVVLLDSLNRHLLGAYGSDEFATPNLDRFAASSVRFDRHYTGSLPCILARHDLLCGALDFRDTHMPYAQSRTWFRGEEDFPGPRTMAATAKWLDDNAREHARFFLLVDEFDPHEPFDTPEPYASAYDPTWTGPHLIWPPYQRGAVARGTLTEREARQVRACYGAKLTMIDHWFGRVVDALERQHLWDDTVVIVCTDHGHYLGEKDIWGKPAVPVYEPLGHIPLFVRWP